MRITTLGKLALVWLTLSAPCLADEVTLKATKVRGSVYFIEGVGGFAGGNVAASIGSDGVLVVDSLVVGRAPQLIQTLNKLAPDAPLRYLLNTHWHGDHTGGNAKLAEQVPIIAQDNVRRRLMVDQKNYFGPSAAAPEKAWPVMTFNDAMTVYFNGETIKLKHYPHGHTDGDSMVYFAKANVLHMGDQYFSGMFPFVDLTTGGSVLGLVKNVAKVIEQMPEDVIIIPGHGAISNMAELKDYYQMLKTTVRVVRQGIKQGLTLKQIQDKGLGAELASYGNGFIPERDWIAFTWQSIEDEGKGSHGHTGSGAPHHH